MYVYSTTKEPAENAAATLTAKRRGAYALGWDGEAADDGKIVVGYVVIPYRPGHYGVVERWHYADCPERGTFGGAFIARDTIVRLLQE